VKTILSVADGGPALDDVLSLAARCAAQFESVHDVLHVRDIAAMGAAAAVAGFDGAIATDFTPFQKRAAERAARARSGFERVLGREIKASFVELEGVESELVVQHGRVSDLIVVGRPGIDPDKPEPAYVSAALFESARPVLTAPPGMLRWPLRDVAIAWNGSAQAARAVGYALPFLKRAEVVTVLTIGAPETRAATTGIVRFLSHHGIKARSDNLDLGSVSARARGRGVLRYVDDNQVDLLVMGAYGHGAVMKFLGMGGATGKVISACKVPVLLAH
jgi:nucleotide-binding universal stress UspA family protein